jgi:type II secretory pathway pseudopilin PulG
MREFVTIRMPWRSLLVIGLVAMVAVPSWSLSQQPQETKKADKSESKDKVIHLNGEQVQSDVIFQLASDDNRQPQSKEADRLDRLEKQLDALLNEIKTLRGEKGDVLKRVNKLPDGKVVITHDGKAEPKKADNEQHRYRVIRDDVTGAAPKVSGDTVIRPEPKVDAKVVIMNDGENQPKKAEKEQHNVKVIRADGASWSTSASADDKRTFAFTVNAGDGNSTMLSRTTYKMPKEKAEALANFLKDQVKGQVLETKVDGDSIVVTTTPAAQNTIGQFIALVQGKAKQQWLNFHATPDKSWEPVEVHFNDKTQR